MGKKWTLDSAIDKAYNVEITINSLFSNIVSTSSSSYNNSIVQNIHNGTASTSFEENIAKNVTMETYTYTYTGGSAGYNTEYTINDNGNNICKIYFDTGQIEFYVLTAPPIEGEDNIEVSFVPKDKPNPELILQCDIGTLFGAEGNNDRLFLAGNASYPNLVYYSAFDDVTYFPFENYLTLGNSSNSVVAFTRLSDSTLGIHKSSSSSDPTIYYITYGEVTIGETPRTAFTITTGTIGEAPLSCNTNFSLAGDNLFLSKNGVYGMQLSSNIKSNERYAVERSNFINSKLTKLSNLASAKAIVYKNRYYLAVGESVYIADARFKTGARNEDMNDTYNYEWWYYDNIQVKQWLIINDELCFLSNSGKLNKFYNGHEDIESFTLGVGDFTISGDDKIAYNNNFDAYLYDMTEVKFQQLALKVAGTSEIRATNGDKMYFNDLEVLNKFSLSKNYFYKKSNTAGGTITNEYVVIRPVEINTTYKYITFAISGTYSQGSISINNTFNMSPLYSDFDTPVEIGEILNDTYVFIVNIDKDENEFSLTSTEYGSKQKIMHYSIDTSIKFLVKNNVVSVWQTPICSLGTTIYSKNLLSNTLVFEPNIEGKIKYGYRTSNNHKEYDSTLRAGGLDFTNFDFTEFSLANSFGRSRTIKSRVRNFCFIDFVFESDDGRDCALNNFTITYNIGSKNKGVR